MKTECWQKNKGSNGSKVFSFFNYNKFQAVIAIIVLFFTYHLAHSQQISFTPDSIEAAITNCGDSVTEQLVISNAGSSVLNYNIYLPLEVVLNNLNINYTQIIDSIPNRYDFTDGVTGTNISDGTGDMYDGGNYLGTNLGQYISYSDNSINTSSYLGTNCSYFTRKYTGLFVFCAELNGINYFEITGNLGADGGGSVDTARIHYQYFGKDYYGYIKRVYNAGDPSVNHLIIVNTDTLTQEYATSTDNDYHRINNLSGITRIYYLLYAGSSGNYIDSAATVSIMQGF
ncbi:MAG: hypothetical protein JXB17_05785, partial [Bacteroidales bacterium]|nr:hypothetical protein [Bacteroidales bacterium]